MHGNLNHSSTGLKNQGPAAGGGSAARTLHGRRSARDPALRPDQGTNGKKQSGRVHSAKVLCFRRGRTRTSQAWCASRAPGFRGVIILDTNVISELMRPMPATQVVRWIDKQPAAGLFTTSISEAEISYGIELLPRGKRREGLLAAAEAMFIDDFAGRVLGFDSNAARAFAAIAARRRALGKPISHPGAQIAALTRLHGAALATRNVADFDGCDIPLIDPWVG